MFQQCWCCTLAWCLQWQEASSKHFGRLPCSMIEAAIWAYIKYGSWCLACWSGLFKADSLSLYAYNWIWSCSTYSGLSLHWYTILYVIPYQLDYLAIVLLIKKEIEQTCSKKGDPESKAKARHYCQMTEQATINIILIYEFSTIKSFNLWSVYSTSLGSNRRSTLLSLADCSSPLTFGRWSQRPLCSI